MYNSVVCSAFGSLGVEHEQRETGPKLESFRCEMLRFYNVNSEQHDRLHIIMVVMNVVNFENCIRKIKQILCKTCGVLYTLQTRDEHTTSFVGRCCVYSHIYVCELSGMMVFACMPVPVYLCLCNGHWHINMWFFSIYTVPFFAFHLGLVNFMRAIIISWKKQKELFSLSGFISVLSIVILFVVDFFLPFLLLLLNFISCVLFVRVYSCAEIIYTHSFTPKKKNGLCIHFVTHCSFFIQLFIKNSSNDSDGRRIKSQQKKSMPRKYNQVLFSFFLFVFVPLIWWWWWCCRCWWCSSERRFQKINHMEICIHFYCIYVYKYSVRLSHLECI